MDMNIREKSAYLKGLAEGLKLDPAKDETKLLNAIIDLLGDITEAVDEMDDDMEVLNDYIEEIDEDLGAVEEIVYEEYDCDCCDDDDCDCDCDCDDDDCDCCCDCDDENFRMLMCPHCDEEIYFDDSIEPDELICPACGKAVADEPADAE